MINGELTLLQDRVKSLYRYLDNNNNNHKIDSLRREIDDTLGNLMNQVNIHSSEFNETVQSKTIENTKIRNDLEQRERFYRSLIEYSADIITVLDEYGNVIFESPAHERILGYSKGELLGKNVFEYIHPDDLENTERIFEKIKYYSHATDFAIRFKHKNGSWRYLEGTGKNYLNDNNIIGIIINAKDVSERKEKESEKEELLHNIRERAKELKCLYSLSNLVETPGIQLSEIFQRLVEIIPKAWQYPDITSARIAFEEYHYKSDNFQESKWKQSSKIVIDEQPFGAIDVFYLEEKPEKDEGPFLKDERNLINALAGQLGRIIKRKRLEDLLKENNKRHNVFLRNFIGIAYQVSYLTFRPNFMYGKTEEITGYANDDFIEGRILWSDIILPEDMKRKIIEEDNIRNIPGYISDIEYRIMTKNGKIKWVRDVGSKQNDGNGKIACFQGTIYDISEKRRLENKYRKSEKLYRTIAESAKKLAINIVDYDGKFTYANNTVAEQCGYGSNAEKLVGRYFYEFMPNENKESLLNNIRQVFKSKRGFNDSAKVSFHDKDRWFLYSFHPLLDSYGEVESVLTVATEVTELKESQKALVESEEKYRNLVEYAEYAIMIIDYLGNVKFINRFGAFELGFKPEDIIGKNIREFFPQKVAVRHLWNIQKVIDRRKEKTIDSPTIIKNKMVWHRTSIIPQISKDSNIDSALLMSFDISSSMKYQEDLKMQKAHLRALSNRIIELQEDDRKYLSRELHDTVSQELAAAIMKLGVGKVLIGENNTDEAQSAINEASGFISTASDMIRNVSRELRPQILDEKGLIPAIRWYLENYIVDIETSIAIEGEIAELGKEIEINLFRIIQEIISNTIKHANASKILINIKCDNAYLRVKVQDDGRGFDYNKHKQNWEKHPSYGLINIAERLELIGADWEVQSGDNKGTLYHICIPLMEE